MALVLSSIQMVQSTKECSAMGNSMAEGRSLKLTVMCTSGNGLVTRPMEEVLSSIAHKVYATLVNGLMTLSMEWVRKHGTMADALSM
jgi:hypothetical protein